MASQIKIKDWKETERPREKMLFNGASSLSDSELLAILIRTGNTGETAVDLSRKLLLEAHNSLRNLSLFSIEKMGKVKGIGKAKAVSIMAAFELALRLSSETLEDRPTISSSSSVVKVISPHIKDLQHEECWVLYLNRANKLIAKERISIGGVSATVMDSRVIIKKAVEKLASSIIIVHNHPSGNPYPGEQDKKQTRLLKDAAALLDISLIDHIIVAGDRYYSFSDETVRMDVS